MGTQWLINEVDINVPHKHSQKLQDFISKPRQTGDLL